MPTRKAAWTSGGLYSDSAAARVHANAPEKQASAKGFTVIARKALAVAIRRFRCAKPKQNRIHPSFVALKFLTAML